MHEPAESPLHEIESVTRSYARFSRSAGGLASVLGGAACLVSYFAGALLPLTPAVRAGLVALPIVWLIAKQLLMQRYYQRFGHVEEQEGAVARRVHIACVATTLVVAAVVTVGVGFSAHAREALPFGVVGYLALVWLLALAAWRWLRSPLDFIVGTFLFCQAALACAGTAYPIPGFARDGQGLLTSLIALLFPLAALKMLVAGFADHRRFVRLRERIARLRGDADRGAAA
ncbi:MAG TPA: hypothetical protein VGC30_12245 [Dokdonella sp.]